MIWSFWSISPQFSSKNYHSAENQNITDKDEARVSCQRERSLVFWFCFFPSCCCFPFEAELHIYWFMIMELWLWGLGSQTPHTLLARRLGAATANHPPTHWLHIMSGFLFFLSFFLSIQIHSQFWLFHIFAFFNNSDLLITTRQSDVLWIFVGYFFFSRHLVVVLSFRSLFHLPAGSPASRINVLFYSLGSKYPIENRPKEKTHIVNK